MEQFVRDQDNHLFGLATKLVCESDRNIFLTGKAGTGKTTFLRYIQGVCRKKKVVVAPTGVAAINAGGVTIHSFFNIPLGPFVPGPGTFDSGDGGSTSRQGLLKRLRINSDKRKMMQQLELLIIDEVSMVRCDLLDAVDTVLRYIRQKPYERFGGVQVLFIGDLFQLPPVTPEKEWGLIRNFYDSPYFFDSHVLRDETLLYIEFEKIYRQRDDDYINLLNQVRHNTLDQHGKKLLLGLYQPEFIRRHEDGYIVLTSHNHQADETNRIELMKLPGNAVVYQATIEGDFSERNYPGPERLLLKPGARVMFNRNDPPEKGKRFFNGKLATVVLLDGEKIVVKPDDDDALITVEKETWENVRYAFNSSTYSITQDVIGSFIQFPLRLAWAVTIHKSQGLTFHKVIIDAADAFAAGQVYVALSRCTTLRGLVLSSKINIHLLQNDPRVLEFSSRKKSMEELELEFAYSRERYFRTQLLTLFDTSSLSKEISKSCQYFERNRGCFTVNSKEWSDHLLQLIHEIKKSGSSHRRELEQSFLMTGSLIHDSPLFIRIKTLAGQFLLQLKTLQRLLLQCPVKTGKRAHAKEINDRFSSIVLELSFMIALQEVIEVQPSLSSLLNAKQEYVPPSLAMNIYDDAALPEKRDVHPKLQSMLRAVRQQISREECIPIYRVVGSNSIEDLVRYLPRTTDELRRVVRWSPTKIVNYGDRFLQAIHDYCEEYNIEKRDEKLSC